MELWEALGERREIARTLARHIAAVNDGNVPQRTKELIALMVSWLNACEACLETHAEVAGDLGVDKATLDDLGDYARSERFSAAERSALAAAVALTREPRALPPSLRDALLEHYAAGDVVEIVAAIGLYNYLTRANNALRSALPAQASRD
jgi:AhpD family alkylhydroperoxidase